ncbi:beta-lactamase superfamily domain-containing protein [Dichotomocladium elegans]|nr:beta-lactamase superfamily domain-containing protein [Dichotomocladium elegans]
MPLTSSNRRFSLANFPIPFDHPYTVPSLIAAVTASSLVYYYLQSSHTADLIEAVRVRDVSKRRHLKRAEQRYASLKVERRFVNPFGEWREVQWWETALFWLCRWKGNGIPRSEDLTHINTRNQLCSCYFEYLRSQSTCLIRMENLTILTDPVFSRCSVNDHFGPKRLRPIPCTIEEIQPYLDIVLVTHDHFDHLDERVVRTLGDGVTWYVPLGLRKWFVKRGVENVVELDWWQEVHHDGHHDTSIACVPAMHWSGHRTLFNKNESLCGDTGYSPELFQAIGERYAPFTLAALPIGSFKPEFLMQHLHMGPSDAVKVHHDLKFPRLSVGIHWGTFMMSDEYYLEPVEQLKSVWKRMLVRRADDGEPEVADTRFITTSIGETICLD